MSVDYKGTTYRLVSYYTIDDVVSSRLHSPSVDARLTDLVIGGDLMTRTNVRLHPGSEAGNQVSRNSPTQQRTQMLMQNQQRRHDDPRPGRKSGGEAVQVSRLDRSGRLGASESPGQRL